MFCFFCSLFGLVLGITFQEVLSTEEPSTARATENPRVVALRDELKNLESSAQRYGPKHPISAIIKSKIEATQMALSSMLEEIENEKAENLIPASSAVQNALSSENSAHSSSNVKVYPSTNQMDLFPRSLSERIGLRLVDDQKAPVYRTDIIAYPFIDTRNMNEVGFFPGTDIAWGLESKPNGNGSISTWVNSWRVKSKAEFARSNGEFICFHPSNHILKDGTWFSVIQMATKGGLSSYELVIGRIVRGTVWESCMSQIDVLMRFDSKDDGSFEMSYNPDSKKLQLQSRESIKIKELKSSVIIVPDEASSILLDLSHCSSKHPLEPLGVEGSNFGFIPGSSDTTFIWSTDVLSARKYIRPFWTKVGKMPSTKPSWYPEQYETIEYWPESYSDPSLSGAKLAAKVNALKPGERLLIHEGIYSIPHRFDVRLRGRIDAPIVIEAAAGERVIITRADDRENLIDIGDSEYLILLGLEFVGGSTGVRIRSANNVVVSSCVIHDVGNVGIAANSHSITGLHILDNEIFNTDGHGEGVYLGAHDGSASVSGSIVSGNYIHDLGNGSEGNQGDGIELKDGCFGNVIQENFIARTKYPNITVYSAGGRSKHPNRILRNVLLVSDDCGIQVNAEAHVEGNLIFNRRFGVVSKPFIEEPHSLSILNNTILTEGYCLKASQWNRNSISFSNNRMYSRDRRYFYAGTGLSTSSDNMRMPNLPTGFREENYLRFMPTGSDSGKISAEVVGFLDDFGFLMNNSIGLHGNRSPGRRFESYAMPRSR
jgi:hypothetical protein